MLIGSAKKVRTAGLRRPRASSRLVAAERSAAYRLPRRATHSRLRSAPQHAAVFAAMPPRLRECRRHWPPHRSPHDRPHRRPRCAPRKLRAPCTCVRALICRRALRIVRSGSRATVRELFPQVRGGRCRSSAARAKGRLHNGFHSPSACATRKRVDDAPCGGLFSHPTHC